MLVQVEQVRLVDRFSNKPTNGTLYLTATHLIFVESNSNNSASAGQEIWVSRLRTTESCQGLILSSEMHRFSLLMFIF